MKRLGIISLLIVSLLSVMGCARLRDMRGGDSPFAAPWVTPNADSTLSTSPDPFHPVPAGYSQLYAILKTVLDEADAKLGEPSKHPMVFAAELITANGNRGTDLLRPDTLEQNRLNLDRLQTMGIRGIKMSIQYPLFSPNFPNYARYLEFYRQVMAEIRKRNMVATVQASVIFASTDYTQLPVSYAGLTFDRFKAEDKQMVQTIVSELHPDYLVIVGEPDTAARLTGIKELNDPAKSAELVQYVLNGLDRGKTKVGAGTGTWSPLTFAERYARDTSVDVISMHMYPVDRGTFTHAYEMAALAKKYGKRVILDEAWLYKTAQPGGGDNVAASEEMFKRDAFSFWQPLDEEFLRVMVKMSDTLEIDFLSPFWSPFFFGYLDYAPRYESMSYAEIRREANLAAAQHLQSGSLSRTGRYYKDLIARH